jgi:hypothetical protein
MKPESLQKIVRLAFMLIGGATLLVALPVRADIALLVDQGVMVETNPEAPPPVEGQDPVTPAEIGTSDEATYVSTGGWAVTGINFIDAATYVFDLATTTEVS